MRTKTSALSTDIVVARDGFIGQLDDGTEVIIKLGQRLKRTDPAVVKWPQFFIDDGEEITPPERPEPDNGIHRYRARKAVRGLVGYVNMNLKAGDVVNEDVYGLTPPELRDKLFELIPS
jgi:hypothetical protein